MQTQQAGMSLRWLLTASFINNVAYGFIWPLTSIYLHDQLYQTLVVIGWVMMANAIGQAVGSLVSGRLFDRFEPRKLMQFGTLMMIVINLLFIFFHGWPSYAVILTLAGFFGGWNTATINSYGTYVRSHDGRFVFNMLYFISNFGMVFATAAVGPIYNFGITWLFWLAFVMYLVLMAIVQFTFKIKVARTQQTEQKQTLRLPKWNVRLIYTGVIGLGVLWISYSQWQGNLSIYMSSILKLPVWQYSMLWTINGILIAIIQLGMNALNLSANRKSMFIQIYAGLIMFGLAFMILPFAKTFTGFAIAMVVTTIGEATAFPMIPALVNELSPIELKGRYQGMTAAAPSVGRAVGPLIGGAVIEQSGYGTMFYGGAGVVFIAFIGVAIMIMIGYRHATQYE